MLAIEERFWEKVDKNGPIPQLCPRLGRCWLWIAARHPRGYGIFSIKKKHIYAHQVSWLLCKGPIPYNLKICHYCDVTSCVNPEHLFIGTQKDNMVDCSDKNRNVKNSIKVDYTPNIPKITKDWRTQLTEDNIKEIRFLCNVKKCSYSLVADYYNINISTIRRIALRETWKHIPE